MVAKPRVVHRDGIRFQGLRYMDPTLAAYVGKPVTIRYDPRDLTQIRVFSRDRFLCRAISAEHARETITLKDIQAARTAHRRALRQQLSTRSSAVADFLPTSAPETTPPPAAEPKRQTTRTPPAPATNPLLVYREDLDARPDDPEDDGA